MVSYLVTLISSRLNLIIALVCGILGFEFLFILEDVGKTSKESTRRIPVCKIHSVFYSDR